MPEAAPQVPRPRIQGLSDLIFGLALSIGALELVSNLPSDPGVLSRDLAFFGFSFLILISVWNRYTTTTSVIPVETAVMIRLNMVLLFLVAIEPFLFDVMAAPSGLGSPVGAQASLYYGVDIGGMNLILAYFTHLLTVEDKKLVPADMIQRFKRTRDALALGGAIFLLSDLPFFWDVGVAGTPMRVILWILTIPLIWGQRFIGVRM